MAFDFVADQRLGSEYGGVQYQSRVVKNTVQPKAASALTLSEKLRLDALTGQQTNPMAMEDLRQFVGLRHSDGRPSWFVTGQPVGPTYAEAWQATQNIIDATQNWI